MPSAFTKHLAVKVIGTCLYEIYFNKEYKYSAKTSKTIAKALSVDIYFKNIANLGMVFKGK